jgi:two-component system response regulator RegX3
LGADDYVCKPFSVRELMARVKAVLRRTQPEAAETAPVLTGPGGLRLDVERREVTVGNISIELTRLEFDLLHMLLLNTGRVLTRERLLEQVWGYDFAGDTRAVDSAVKRLRARLRSADPQADNIEAVRGLGYKFKGGRS